MPRYAMADCCTWNHPDCERHLDSVIDWNVSAKKLRRPRLGIGINCFRMSLLANFKPASGKMSGSSFHAWDLMKFSRTSLIHSRDGIQLSLNKSMENSQWKNLQKVKTLRRNTKMLNTTLRLHGRFVCGIASTF